MRTTVLSIIFGGLVCLAWLLGNRAEAADSGAEQE